MSLVFCLSFELQVGSKMVKLHLSAVECLCVWMCIWLLYLPFAFVVYVCTGEIE